MDEDTGLNPAACKKRQEFDSLRLRSKDKDYDYWIYCFKTLVP